MTEEQISSEYDILKQKECKNREKARKRYWEKKGYDEIPPRNEMYHRSKPCKKRRRNEQSIASQKRNETVLLDKLSDEEKEKEMKRLIANQYAKNYYWRQKGFDTVPKEYVYESKKKLTEEEKIEKQKQYRREYYWIKIKGCSKVPEIKIKTPLSEEEKKKRREDYLNKKKKKMWRNIN